MSVPTPILAYSLSDATMRGLLPTGYTPLAYIESTGTLWIDTGYLFSTLVGARLEGKAVFTDSNSDYAVLFGCANANSNTFFNVVLRQNSYLYFDYGARNGTCTYSDIIKNINFEFSATIATLSLTTVVNGVSKTNSASPTLSSPLRNAYLFAYNEAGNTYYKTKAKVYYWRIFSSSGLLMDLRPACRDSDGVIGMYDLVSRTFKTNAGSGAFIAGPPLAVGKGGGKSLPEEYLLVEYLEGDGNSYIDTGVNDLKNIMIECELNNPTPSNDYLYGGLLVSGMMLNGLYGNSALEYNRGSISYTTSSKLKMILTISGNNTIINFNGTSTTVTTPTSDGTGTIWLYACRNNSGDLRMYHSGLLIYYFKMSIGTTLTRKFIPCYRKSDMKPGMYDTVTGTFYTNLGSGEFILGPTVTNYYSCEPNASAKLALNPYDKDMYYESDGSRWMRIFHHNNPTNSKFASGVNLSNAVYESADKWSCINLINKDLGNWELMLKQKNNSDSSEVKYRWIQYYNPFIANWSQVLPGNVLNVSGYSSNQGGMWKINSETYFCIANSSSSNWFGAIGSWTEYDGGIPGYPNSTCKTGYMDLYVRIDNNPSFEPIGLYTNVNATYDSTKSWSASFDGSTSKFIIPKNVILSLTDSFTIAGWFNITSWSSAYQMLFLFARETTSTAWASTIVGLHRDNTTSKLDFAISNASSGTTSNCLTPSNLSLNTWYHIVCVYNKSSNSQIYINGVLSKQYNHSIVPDVANVSRCQLGMANYAGTLMYKCAENVLNFMIFNTALTAAQVKELYGK